MTDIEWLEPDGVAPLADGDATSDAQPAVGLPRRAAVVLLVLSLLAAGGAVLGWRVRSSDRILLDVHTPASYRGVDAVGCPIGVSCRSAAVVMPSLRAIAQAKFPGAEVLDLGMLFDGSTGRSLATELTMTTTDGVLVRIASQCLPDHRVIPSSAPIAAGVGPADVVEVVGGPPGCAVTVNAHVPAGVAIPATTLGWLATDRNLVLATD